MRGILAFTATMLAAPSAWACGQSTHVWIGIHAVDHLPEGELKALIGREDLFPYLVNGAMFPDGGYSPIVRDGYGETAHWEPFQTAWMDWIRDTWGPDFTEPEADGRIAFLLGLAAHGMADQVFDGIYLTRSVVYDGEARWAAGSPDTATDVAMTSIVGPMPIVDDVVPYDDLVHVFGLYGQPVDKDKLLAGQASLRLAVQWVGNVGQTPEAEEHKAQFPWASEHLVNPAMPGSPACISEVVAAYWQTLWDRLHTDFDHDANAVIHTFPGPDEANHPTSTADIESQIGAVFGRAVDLATLDAEAITVTDEAGDPHPVSYRMYYGHGSNVLNLYPSEDWADDTVYTVTVNPGLASYDGVVLSEAASFRFTTGDVAIDPVDEAAACAGCRTAGGAPIGWVALGALALLRHRRG